jgi:hypothetical protein
MIILRRIKMEAYSEFHCEAQLNCCTNTDAKKELWKLAGQILPSQQALPLEPVVVMVGKYKMTSGSEDSIVYWCNKILALGSEGALVG